jgi:hypothetical protein
MRFLLQHTYFYSSQSSSHCVRKNVGIFVMTFSNGKRFGLVDMYFMEQMSNTTADTKGKASSAVIPTVHGTSFRGLGSLVKVGSAPRS